MRVIRPQVRFRFVGVRSRLLSPLSGLGGVVRLNSTGSHPWLHAATPIGAWGRAKRWLRLPALPACDRARKLCTGVRLSANAYVVVRPASFRAAERPVHEAQVPDLRRHRPRPRARRDVQGGAHAGNQDAPPPTLSSNTLFQRSLPTIC